MFLGIMLKNNNTSVEKMSYIMFKRASIFKIKFLPRYLPQMFPIFMGCLAMKPLSPSMPP
jgi:hypothetical protein